MVLRGNNFNARFLCLTIEGCFGFQNQMAYVKMVVKDLRLTVNYPDVNSHPAASGQLDYIRIIWSFLIFQQIKTYINSLEPEGEKIFLCFLSVTLNYCNTCYEFLISFNMSLVRRQNHLGMANKTVE